MTRKATRKLHQESRAETGIPTSEMKGAMMNRAVWKNVTVRETTIPK